MSWSQATIAFLATHLPIQAAASSRACAAAFSPWLACAWEGPRMAWGTVTSNETRTMTTAPAMAMATARCRSARVVGELACLGYKGAWSRPGLSGPGDGLGVDFPVIALHVANDATVDW